MLFIDLHLYTGEKTTTSEKLFEKYSSNINYIYHLSENYNSIFIQHAGFEKQFTQNGVKFWIKKSNNERFFLSFLPLFRKVKKLKPDVVLLHGMIQPLNILLAKFVFGSSTKVMVQNHAEQPFGFKKRWLQKLVAPCVSAFIFVSKAQAKPWIKSGIIKHEELIFEVMEGSTHFQLNKNPEALSKSTPQKELNFIWVGRLDSNKDPLTILQAFARFVKLNINANLVMIYNESNLLKEVQNYIYQNDLSSHVKLLGQIDHKNLEDYYNNADYFILGSHYEGSGYALCEAMACGCVPIVTRIPSFEKMVDRGECGFLFEPGNSNELYLILSNLSQKNLSDLQLKVVEKFEKDLSFQAIAKQMESVLKHLTLK